MILWFGDSIEHPLAHWSGREVWAAVQGGLFSLEEFLDLYDPWRQQARLAHLS